MNNDAKELLRSYGELKKEEKRIKKELDEKKELVREVLMGTDEQAVDMSGLGKLSIKDVPVWTYSDDTMLMKAALKEKEKVEKQMGIATSKMRHDVIFNEEK